MENQRIIKSLAFRIMAIALSLVVMLIVLEITLRICGPRYYKFNNKSSEYYSNPRGYFVPIGKDGKDTVYGLNHNHTYRGYRLPLNTISDKVTAKQTYTLGLGDSFTFGRSVKYNDIYLTRLENLLEQNGYSLAVDNRGKVAADLEEIFIIYLIESSNKDYPVVVYGFVLNDFGLPGKENIIGLDFIDINNGGYSYNSLRKTSSLYNFVCHLIEKKKLHDVTIKAYHDAFEGDYTQEKFRRLGLLNQEISDKNSRAGADSDEQKSHTF